MKKKLQIPVIFRRIGPYLDAYFPTLPHTDGNILSYCHSEGHNEADYFYAIKGRLATPEEYTPLLRELRAIYDDDEQELVVRKRIATYWDAMDSRYRKAVTQ